MPLPSYRKRIFRVLSRSSPSARKRDLDRDRIPAFSKAGIQFHPPPRHRGYAAKPPDGHRRRCESAMPTTQASPAVGATRPLRRRAATGRGGTSHQTQSSKRVRAKLMPLPSYRKRIFRSAVKVKPFGAQARPDRDRIPAFSKAGIRHPPPRHRGYAAAPDGHRRRCESAMPTTQASPAVGATRPLRRRAATGREGLHTKRKLPRG